MQVAEFTEMQPEYRYFQLENGEADIFIYDFVKEEIEEENKKYIYNVNEFRTKEITEEMIKENPKKYLNYIPREISIEDRLEALEEGLLDIGEVIANG